MQISRRLAVFLLALFAIGLVTILIRQGTAKEDGATLTDDGRIGKIVDAQGTTAIKPLGHERWTPACGELLLKPGDWLRTDTRGANAMHARLSNGTSLILGPGTLVELTAVDEIRLLNGEAEVVVPKGKKLVLKAPGDKRETIEGTKIFRVRNEKLTLVAKEPKWLAGFKGSIQNETLGSLIAKVDGRNVPLTVGYHKVSVDIRDQIARTTIEESFVNHTDGQLEGVFYFPLPADASISGFGMWIGNELVEADVVEKQRAREIYETILRERRDPGLLEWSGGNLFKARVFPIFAHSEKRIKITYTQVLPLRGNSYRYSYALQSEMLKQNPLRELKIDVKLSSTLGLKSVVSPTHTTRQQQTKNSAQLEFSAQEYTPLRDFEVVVELESKRPEVVFVPHQRGSDGYFMLQINSPGGNGPTGTGVAASGGWEREILPNGEPLDLLILADTSGSMDRSLRTSQDAFIAALLSSLGPKDRFNLATCDVTCDWANQQSKSADEKSISAAREFLSRRRSLGWTDLDAAFKSVLEKVGQNTQVIYVGDGITTSGDADPVAFANRLKQIYGGKGTFHAVTPGSTYESAVLKAIASLGGGSVRRIAADADSKSPGSATAIARQLLSEIAQPSIRDLKIEFAGLRAARVYPEELPNLPAGLQQIVLGRYLPDAASSAGEVIVTGTLNGKPVRYRTAVSLEAAAKQAAIAAKQAAATPAMAASQTIHVDENSFIPRLWARLHLDALLAQGSSQAIQDEIIGLSEEYQIMTPYTSFLVLESDADRERFKVKRRFQMRDGEKFFATGRDNVNFELKQQQMQRAGNWRIGLQRQVLRQLATMGRNPQIFQPQEQDPYRDRFLGDRQGAGGFGGGNEWFFKNTDVMSRSESLAGMPLGGAVDYFADEDMDGKMFDGFAARSGKDYFNLADASKLELSENQNIAFDGALPSDVTPTPLFAAEPVNGPALPFSLGAEVADTYEREDRGIMDERKSLDFKGAGEWDENVVSGLKRASLFKELQAGRPLLSLANGTSKAIFLEDGQMYGWGRSKANKPRGSSYVPSYDSKWYALDQLFPALADAPAPQTKPFKSRWPAEARAIAQKLLRREQLAKLPGGVQVDIATETFDVRQKRTSHRSNELALISPKSWLTRHGSDNSQTNIQWADTKHRGQFSTGFLLGRVRAGKPTDLTAYSVTSGDYSFDSLERAYAAYNVAVDKQADDRVLLTMSLPNNDSYQIRFLIDTNRNVLLRTSVTSDGKPGSSTVFSDFVQVAGTWWATRIETFDNQERRSNAIKVTVAELSADKIAAAIDQQLQPRKQAILLEEPLPSVRVAKQQLLDNKADFNTHLPLMAYHAATQQWDEVNKAFEAFAKSTGDKPGLRWIRDSVNQISRRHDELRKRLKQEAERLAAEAVKSKSSAGDVWALTTHLLNQANQSMQANESLVLLEKLRPVYDKLSDYQQGEKQYLTQRANYLQQTGQADASFTIYAKLANQYRHDQSLQSQYLNLLSQRGEFETAYTRIDQLLADKSLELLPYEADQYRAQYVQFLENEGRVADMAKYLASWLTLNPTSSTPYQQYLTALLKTDQEDEFNKVIGRWLNEGRIAGLNQAKAIEQAVAADKANEGNQKKTVKLFPMPPEIVARLQAAVSQTLGSNWPWRANRIEERWLEPLADTARALAKTNDQLHLASQIITSGHFSHTDQARAIRREVAARLVAEVDTLSPAQIAMFVQWLAHNDPIVEKSTWKTLADRLQKRWIGGDDDIANKDAAEAIETQQQLRHALDHTIVSILNNHIGRPELLAFHELQYKLGVPASRPAYREQLFNALLNQAWQQPIEDRAFTLLSEIGDEPPLDKDLAEALTAQELAARQQELLVWKQYAQIAALHRLTDRMVIARQQATMAAVENPEKLTRPELTAKQTAALKSAREAISDRLSKERDRYGSKMAAWMTVERTYLDVRLDRNLDKVEGEAWEVVGNKPDSSEIDTAAAWLAAALKNRHLTTLSYLATRKNAKPELIDRLLTYCSQGIADDKSADYWRTQRYRLLVALDRPRSIEKDLRSWIDVKPNGARQADNTWRVALAYLLAEQARFADAIAELEVVQKADELGAAEFRALADWYQVQNQREKHERAIIDALMAEGERRLQHRLNAHMHPWNRGDNQIPAEINPEMIQVFAAIFKKSEQPQNYFWQLQRVYQHTRDFRLLQSVADGVVGHSALRIYGVLSNMQSLLSEVRDEATVDELIAHLKKVREQAKTDVDRRAVDLLELVAERRAAELQNQADPHVRMAVAALQRATSGPVVGGDTLWAPGERRLMAELLANLGQIAAKPLAAEQRRILEALHNQEQAGTIDRLYIAQRLANVRWSYSMQNEAIDLLESALAEFRIASGGVLPQSANDALSTYVGYLQSKKLYERGERVYLTELKTPANAQQRHWLTQQLYSLYNSALGNDGQVSLGKGQKLYNAVEKQLIGELKSTDQNHLYNLINTLCAIYRTAKNHNLSGVGDDLRRFAFDRLPEMLKRQVNNQQSIVSQVASTLREVIDAREGLAFLIERIEKEPRWLRYQGQDGWQQHASYLGHWRTEVKLLGDLEPRLLKIVTDELRWDLQSMQSRNRSIYAKHHNYYWAEKEREFMLVAEEVLEKNMKSSSQTLYVAAYLYHGLEKYDRAIDILLAAHDRKVLGETGQAQLVNFMHERKRFQPSIAILLPLVEKRPENMTYRTQLMHAYFHTQQSAKLLALLKDTDEFFHQKDRWNESAMAALAASTLQNELFEQSVTYYKELIPLHERTAPNRGVGNGTLSHYYTGLAQAFAGLKNTAAAVDAAGAAIVAWGKDTVNRTHALNSLREVLEKSPDLDAYVKTLDKQVADTGLENAIVRKALGNVFLTRKQYANAIAQLKLAVETQPNDSETHRALVKAFDESGDKQAAIEQLFESVQLARRDIALYKDLSERFQALELKDQAERAVTSIVEMLPNESESHAMLAEIRQNQSRWPEAATHWQRVAEIRKLEPTGLLKLASAQVQLKQWDNVRDTIRQIDRRDWPSRFGDVRSQTRELERQVKK